MERETLLHLYCYVYLRLYVESLVLENILQNELVKSLQMKL